MGLLIFGIFISLIGLLWTVTSSLSLFSVQYLIKHPEDEEVKKATAELVADLPPELACLPEELRLITIKDTVKKFFRWSLLILLLGVACCTWGLVIIL